MERESKSLTDTGKQLVAKLEMRSKGRQKQDERVRSASQVRSLFALLLSLSLLCKTAFEEKKERKRERKKEKEEKILCLCVCEGEREKERKKERKKALRSRRVSYGIYAAYGSCNPLEKNLLCGLVCTRPSLLYCNCKWPNICTHKQTPRILRRFPGKLFIGRTSGEMHASPVGQIPFDPD